MTETHGLTYDDLIERREREEREDLLYTFRTSATVATNTAKHWDDIAIKLTMLRAGGVHLPEMPDELGEEKPQRVPFNVDEMRAELDALSGLITKAYTIAAIYRDDAEQMAANITNITNPDVGAEL